MWGEGTGGCEGVGVRVVGEAHCLLPGSSGSVGERELWYSFKRK